MAALIRTSQGRMEAFNPRTDRCDDSRLLVKSIDSKRDFSDLQKAHMPNICNEENIQHLMMLRQISSRSTQPDISNPKTSFF
jgi:hypothetical protein